MSPTDFAPLSKHKIQQLERHKALLQKLSNSSILIKQSKNHYLKRQLVWNIIFIQSSQCLRSDLDLISLTYTKTAVDGSQLVEKPPVLTISLSSPIEFIVSGSGKDYMDLNNTLLEVNDCI